MTTETLFQIHLVLGYVAWLLCFGTYVWPWLRSMDGRDAHRAIATLHSFRFFGLDFILPGIVILAMLALLTVRIRTLFWLFVVAFNLAGTVDLVVDYYDAIQVGLPAHAEWLGSTYAIPIIYVPLLMITHVSAFYFLTRPRLGADAVALAGAG